MMIKVSIDTETGGFDSNIHPCLSIGYVVVECPKLKILERGEILIKASKEQCTSESLISNGIDLDEHNKIAIEPDQAVCRFDEAIKTYFGEHKPQIIGQNPSFDKKFLEQLYKKAGKEFECSYRIVDLIELWRVLETIGVVPQMSSSLDSILDYLQLPEIGKRHSALVDAENVIRVLQFFNDNFINWDFVNLLKSK